MKHSKFDFFSDITYLALNQMDNTASDDERISEEVKETQEGSGDANDEFSTYFTDQKVEIPEDERVSMSESETLAGLEY
jgi:hypothetical protein